MNIHAWSQSSISAALDELNRIYGALDGYYGDEDRSYDNMRADFNMDGTSEEMDVNHKLLMDAKREALDCVNMVMTTFKTQSGTAETTMQQVKNMVNSLRA